MEFNELQEKIIKVEEKYGRWNKIDIDQEYALNKLYEEVGEFAQSWLIHRKKCRPSKIISELESKKMLAEELADIIGITIYNAHLLDINLEQAIEAKWFKYLK